MSQTQPDLLLLRRESKINGLLQAQVLVLEAARNYPNAHAVCMILSDKIAGAIQREQNPQGDGIAKEERA